MSTFLEATKNILDFLEMVPSNSSDVIEFNMDTLTGNVNIIGLVNNKDVSISKVSIYDKSSTEWHSHKETEHYILTKGVPYDIEYEKDNKIYTKTITYGKGFYILPYVPHRLATTNGYSESIVILIPGSDTFPKGQING